MGAIQPDDERRGYKRKANGELDRNGGGDPVQEDVVSGAKIETHDSANWPHIYAHANGKCGPNEQIGTVLVQILGPDSSKGRWIVYANPYFGGEVPTTTGIEGGPDADVHTENISLYHVTTGTRKFGYVHYNCTKYCYYDQTMKTTSP